MMPPDTLKLRVLEAARQQPSRRRTDPVPLLLALVAVAITGMVAMLQWVPPVLGEAGGVAHAAARPAWSAAWIVGGTAVMAAAATWLVLPARRSMLSPPRGVLLAVAIGVPVLVGAWLLFWHSSYADPFTRTGWRCFTLTAVTAPWPFAALVYASRRLEPRSPGLTGAALGAAAGAWAAVMVELWCPLSVHPHVVVGHVAPLVAIVFAAAAFGARAFRVRRA